jgi:hypothetical protein
LMKRWPASNWRLWLPCLNTGWRDWNKCLRTMVISIHKPPVGSFTFLQCLSGTELPNLSGTPYTMGGTMPGQCSSGNASATLSPMGPGIGRLVLSTTWYNADCDSVSSVRFPVGFVRSFKFWTPLFKKGNLANIPLPILIHLQKQKMLIRLPPLTLWDQSFIDLGEFKISSASHCRQCLIRLYFTPSECGIPEWRPLFFENINVHRIIPCFRPCPP